MNAAQAAQVIERAVNALCEAVEETGKIGLPSGQVYASLMDKMSLESYLKLEALAIQTGRIEKSAAHLLTPTGAK